MMGSLSRDIVHDGKDGTMHEGRDNGTALLDMGQSRGMVLQDVG